jgi:hypothetical protein
MKYFKYFKTICIHKWYVFIECCKEGIIWQGIVHDLSKFSPSEFIASAKYYNNDGNDLEYQYAWLHHIAHNKHHWEYWVDWSSLTGGYVLTEIPLKYLKEMYADIVGASKAYNKERFDVREPYNYFMNSKTFITNKEDRLWLEIKLKNLAKTYKG